MKEAIQEIEMAMRVWKQAAEEKIRAENREAEASYRLEAAVDALARARDEPGC